MNILVNELPNTVLSEGRPVKIHCDYLSCLRTIMAFEDNDLADQEKLGVMIANLFDETITPTEDLLRNAIKFLNCDDEQSEISGPRTYSFSKDANLIYAAFRQTHDIDLRKAKLHWWEFIALFMDLGSETTFCQVVGLRKRLKDGSALPEERKMAASMPDVFDIEEIDTSTIDEKEAHELFMKLIAEGEKQK
jgi:hypothetical protein